MQYAKIYIFWMEISQQMQLTPSNQPTNLLSVFEQQKTKPQYVPPPSHYFDTKNCGDDADDDDWIATSFP